MRSLKQRLDVFSKIVFKCSGRDGQLSTKIHSPFHAYNCCWNMAIEPRPRFWAPLQVEWSCDFSGQWNVSRSDFCHSGPTLLRSRYAYLPVVSSSISSLTFSHLVADTWQWAPNGDGATDELNLCPQVASERKLPANQKHYMSKK